jgi:hypothetical protein
MEKFEIDNINNGCGWFIGAVDYPHGYLWHDLTIHPCDTVVEAVPVTTPPKPNLNDT